MRAARSLGPDGVRVEELPDPVPGLGEVVGEVLKLVIAPGLRAGVTGDGRGTR